MTHSGLDKSRARFGRRARQWRGDRQAAPDAVPGAISRRLETQSFAKCKPTPGRQRTPSCLWLTSRGHLTRSGCACSIGLGELFQFPDPSPLTRHPHSSRGLAARFGADAAGAERTNGKPDASAKECLKRNHQGATGVVPRAAASKPPCACFLHAGPATRAERLAQSSAWPAIVGAIVGFPSRT